jgi:hypothetical protein
VKILLLLSLTACQTAPCHCASKGDVMDVTVQMERAFGDLQASLELTKSTPQVCMPNDSN